MAVMTHIRIELWHMDGSVLHKDKMFDSLTELIPGFETYRYTILPNGNPETFRLVIFAYGNEAEGTVLALKSLKLESGDCSNVDIQRKNYIKWNQISTFARFVIELLRHS